MARRPVKVRLKTKILLGILFISSISIGTALYAYLHFQRSEMKLRHLNESYIPLLRVLENLDNQLLLFDYDLERSLRDSQWRPNRLQIKMMATKIKSLKREISININLPSSFEEKIAELEKVFSELQANIEIEAAIDHALISAKRNRFKQLLQNVIKDVEDNMGETSLSVQMNAKTSTFIIGGFLGLSFISMLILVFFTGEALKPLQALVKRMKRISELGLDDLNSIFLPEFHRSNDEIRIVSREFNRMASSLADRNLQLDRERRNLESAHKEMAKQNNLLRKTQKKLLQQEKLALVGKLSAQVAHEIRNPLNSFALHF